MNRRQALLEIAASFEDDYVVSIGPDLPELLEGPDVLAGRSGRLTAVFVPKSDEMRHPDRLRTRLILSRLALPDHTQCLLGVDDNLRGAPSLKGMEHDFHAVVHIDDRTALRRVRSKPLEAQHIPASTRRLVEGRMTFLLGLSHPPATSLIDDEDDVLDEPPTQPIHHPDTSSPDLGIKKATWTGPILRKSDLAHFQAQNLQVQDGVLVAGTNGQHLSVRERLLPYLTLATTTGFQVDNGVPYPYRPTVGVLVVKDAPRSGADPIKPQRASAFAGWALLTNPTHEEFSRYVLAASEWLKGSVSDRD